MNARRAPQPQAPEPDDPQNAALKPRESGAGDPQDRAPPSPTRAFRLTIEYDGARYAGWQRQPNAPTVQETLEESLGKFLHQRVRADAAGRTDAGVHARGQVVKIVAPGAAISGDALRRAANAYLPDDVRVVSAVECSPDFDPRRDARLRWYRYSILARPSPPAIDRFRLTHVARPLDWGAVDRGLALLRGEHDFRAFRSSACRAPRTRLTLVEASRSDERPVHHFDFKCRSFLHHMVRRMVGLLLEIGAGRHPPDIILDMFETGRCPRPFRTAPPQGLTLMRVDYADGEEPA